MLNLQRLHFFYLTTHKNVTVPQGFVTSGLTLPVFNGSNGNRKACDFGINTENFIEYATYDFDLGAVDYKYVYLDANGNEVQTIDAAKVAEMTEVASKADISATKYYKTLAYPDSFYGKFELYVDTDLGKWYDASNKKDFTTETDYPMDTKEKSVGLFYIREDENGNWWVVTAENNFENGAVMLSNKVGVLDHFTYVFKVVDSDLTATDNTVSVSCYLYVNGEYVKSMGTTTGLYGYEFKRFCYAFNKADYTREKQFRICPICPSPP